MEETITPVEESNSAQLKRRRQIGIIGVLTAFLIICVAITILAMSLAHGGQAAPSRVGPAHYRPNCLGQCGD